MTVCLDAFLRIGKLGEDWIGKSAREIVALIGEPDAKGGTSNKYQHPNIYLYGMAELNFARTAPYLCTSLFVDYEKSPTFQFAQGITISDWPWTSATTREETEAYLQENALTATPVRLFFDEDKLVALGIS